MGQDNVPDMLCLSFSATDYGGHQFGIHAEEVQDIYLRLDRDIARLLRFIDAQYGKDNVLVFLTADHGGGETPIHLNDLGIPAGVYPESRLDSALTAHLQSTFSIAGNPIAGLMNQMIWFNHALLDSLKVDKAAVLEASKAFIRQQPGIYAVHTQSEIMQLPSDYFYAPLLRKGIHPRRSGDIYFQLDPNWHPDDQLFLQGGATHGSSYAYDTHVPLVWYGAGVRPGKSYRPTTVCDIAPTLAALLRIMEPSANTGKVIERVLER
jgi:predicted AlkP superfamily pyrophosphatase or phosphodiesterase